MRAGISLPEVLVTVVIAAMVLTAVLSIHSRIQQTAAGIIGNLDGMLLPTEILQLIAEGLTNKEIGELIHLSVKTVSTHRQRVMDKLNIHNVVGLTKYAIREGLTSTDAGGIARNETGNVG